MEDLMNALIRANHILVNVYARWNESNAIRQEAQLTYDRQTREQKSKTGTAIVIMLVISWCITGLMTDLSFSLFHSNALTGTICFLLFLCTHGVSLFVFLSCVLPIRKTKQKKTKEAYDAAMEQAAEVYQSANAMLEENTDAFTFLPFEYCDPFITGYLIKCLQEQRAFTLQQALDKYDEYKHRLTMEQNQQQILIQQRNQMQQLNSIRSSIDVNTAVTAAGFAASIVSRL